MNILERIGFSWVLAWVWMETFVPGSSHAEKVQMACVTTLCIGYLYGAHTVAYKKVKGLFKKA